MKTSVDTKIQITYAIDKTAVACWKMKQLRRCERTRQWMWTTRAFNCYLKHECAVMELEKHAGLFPGYGQLPTLAMQMMLKTISFVQSGQRARPELREHGRKYSVSKKR